MASEAPSSLVDVPGPPLTPPPPPAKLETQETADLESVTETQPPSGLPPHPQKPVMFSHAAYELTDGDKLTRKEDAGAQTIEEMETLLDSPGTYIQVRICGVIFINFHDCSLMEDLFRQNFAHFACCTRATIALTLMS